MPRFLIAVICLFILSCNDNDAEQYIPHENGIPKKLTEIQWLDSAKNLGKITEGQKVALSFRFRNSGENPLIIQSVQPACGCTIAEYPKEPIAPGEEGEITGTFNSEGREGLQHKELTVSANIPGSGVQTVSFEVEVQKKPGAASASPQ
ncbi:MAG: DUF1573 domain-containing protein [Chitinophagaceae bacterium]|nr:DUF1573 domain-containing protein [Chitinophagaceae bacterium]